VGTGAWQAARLLIRGSRHLGIANGSIANGSIADGGIADGGNADGLV
jgi:hypothetical protein